MSNDLAVQPAIVIFDKGRGEACGVAPVGVADPTFFAPVTKTQREAGGVRALATNDAGQLVDPDGNVGGVPVGAVTDLVTGRIDFFANGKAFGIALPLLQFMPQSGDVGAALQAAHDALPAAGGRIEVPAGTYYATTSAVFTKPVFLAGQGAGSSAIYTNDPTLNVIQTSARIVVSDMYFRYNGTSGAQSGCSAIVSSGGFGSMLLHSFFDLFDIAVDFREAWGVTAAFCRFWDNKTYGMSIANNSSPDTGDHEFIGLQFANSQFATAPAAIYWKSSGGMKIIGGKFLAHNYAILCDVPDGVNTKILTLNGVSLEGMRLGALKVSRPSGGTTGTLNSIVVNGCQFGGRGEWGATPKILDFGAGVSDVSVCSNIIEGGGASGNYGVYFEDGYLGGGLVQGNEFFDINTAMHFPDQGANVRVGINSYKGTVKTRQEGAGTQGSTRGGTDPVVTDISAWAPNQNGTTFWLYKLFIPANEAVEIEVSFGGIQNGANAHSRYRRFVAWNNGGSIALTDITAEVKVGTTTVTWSEYTGVVGTSSGDDGVTIGVKPALSQTLQGELLIRCVGQVNGVRRLDNIGLVNASYRWIQSASGTGEFYLQTAAGGNPNLQFPAAVNRNLGTAGSPNYTTVARGAPGALAADRWGYGDNDSLGYSTIYVRLPDGSDPDSNIANYITCAA